MNTQITATPKLYIGIDIHKRSWKVHCATDLFAGKSFSMSPIHSNYELTYQNISLIMKLRLLMRLVVVAITHIAVSRIMVGEVW